MRHFPDQQHRSPAVRTVAGRFAPNDINPIVNANNVGLGFTVARNGVGSFRVTILGKYTRFLDFEARLISASDTFCSVDLQGLPVVTGDNTIVGLTLSQLVAGVPTPFDIAPDPDTWISFAFHFLDVTGKG